MLEAVDGQLCRPELREWLISSAGFSLNHIDRLLVVLDAQYVDNVTDLARWAKLASFDTCLMPVAAVKIRDALARQEIGACGTEIAAGAAGAANFRWYWFLIADLRNGPQAPFSRYLLSIIPCHPLP